jgi:hypothetical protein
MAVTGTPIHNALDPVDADLQIGARLPIEAALGSQASTVRPCSGGASIADTDGDRSR